MELNYDTQRTLNQQIQLSNQQTERLERDETLKAFNDSETHNAAKGEVSTFLTNVAENPSNQPLKASERLFNQHNSKQPFKSQ